MLLPEGLLDPTSGAYEVQLVLRIVGPLLASTVATSVVKVTPAPVFDFASQLESQLSSSLASALLLDAYEEVLPVISTGGSVMSSNPVGSMFDPVSTMDVQSTMVTALQTGITKVDPEMQSSAMLKAAQVFLIDFHFGFDSLFRFSSPRASLPAVHR